jgi:uncharacterized protein HemX
MTPFLTVFLILLAAAAGLGLFLWDRRRLKAWRQVIEARLEKLGRESFDRAQALDRRCDDLAAQATDLAKLAQKQGDRLVQLDLRVRLFEMTKTLEEITASQGLDPERARLLAAEIERLRHDLLAEP